MNNKWPAQKCVFVSAGGHAADHILGSCSGQFETDRRSRSHNTLSAKHSITPPLSWLILGGHLFSRGHAEGGALHLLFPDTCSAHLWLLSKSDGTSKKQVRMQKESCKLETQVWIQAWACFHTNGVKSAQTGYHTGRACMCNWGICVVDMRVCMK
jgi:hypothetical protein